MAKTKTETTKSTTPRRTKAKGPSLRQRLTQLETLGLVNLTQKKPELEYLFRHALVQDAAYESLLRQDRKNLHLLVGEILEELYADRVAEFAPMLGQHFSEAGEKKRALAYFELAGQTATERYALPEAIAHYTQALTLAHGLTQPLAALYRKRGGAYDLQGNFDHAQLDYEAAIRAANTEGDQQTEWQTLLDFGLLWSSRDYGRAGEFVQRALALAQTMHDEAILAHTYNRIGNWHMNRGQIKEAAKYHHQALTVFETLNDNVGRAETLDLLGMTYGERGDFRQSLEFYDRAIQLFRELNARPGLVSALTMAGFLETFSYIEGDVVIRPNIPQALEHIEQGLQLAQTLGLRGSEAYARFVQAMSYTELYDYARAFEAAEAGLAIAESIQHLQWLTANHLGVGVLQLEWLALPTALPHLEEAHRLAETIGSLIWKNYTVSFLALAHILNGQLDAAAQTLAILSEQNLSADTELLFQQSLVWQAHISLAFAQGQPAEALRLIEIFSTLNTNAYQWGEHNYLRVLLIKASALMQLDRLAEAEAVLRSAPREAERRGLMPRLWRAHLAFATLYQRQGKMAEAAQARAEAQAGLQHFATLAPTEALRQTFLTAAQQEFDKTL